MCGGCGRTDTTPWNAVWKIVVDIGECGRIMCHMEKITPAYCSVCCALTWPATGSIPGTWAGPSLRRTIMNLHEVTPAVRGISKVLKSNHGCDMSEGAVSNCLLAMARHIRNGTLVEWGVGPKAGPPPCGPRPHMALPAACAEPRRSRNGTAWPARRPPLLARIEEMASMASYVMVDESHVNVAGSSSQEIVLLTPGVAIVRIEEDRSKITMGRVFRMALRRPLVADMYRGANAFTGEFQTCNVHVWRKSESMAVKLGIESPEHTYCTMLLEVYRRAKAAARQATDMAGGPARSARDIGRAMRTTPGMAGFVESAQADMARGLATVAQAYRQGEVADPESRKFADTLDNAAPYMGTFIAHPGMPGTTNDVDRAIRGYVVRPRSIQRILPDWAGARTLEMLQTIHATCAIRGTFPGDVVSGRRGCWDLEPAGLGGRPPGRSEPG